MLENLQKYHILLASKSPRRRELLQQLRIPFHTIALGKIDENYPDTLPPQDVAQYISEMKANAYADIIKDDELIITADTVVICDSRILGKPGGIEEAKNMLNFLSGKTHTVATGVTISSKETRTSFTCLTDVKFATLTDRNIEYYVENFLPFDKAGAYGIQEWIGCIAVESINGSYYNVMGLPLHRLYKELRLF